MRFALQIYIDEMRTFVLLAAFLLAAAATPIEHHNSGTSLENTVETGPENGLPSHPGDVSSSASEQNYSDSPADGAPSNDGQHEPPSVSSPEDNSRTSTEHQTSEDGENAGDQDVDGDGDTNNTSVTTVSTATKRSSSVSETTLAPASNASEGSTAPITTQSVADGTYESTVSTTSESLPVSPNENVTLPPDSDPTDCVNGSQPHHIYQNCSFICQGDMAEVASNGQPCYIYPTGLEPSVLQIGVGASRIQERSELEQGICLDGSCVSRKHANLSDLATSPSSSVY